MLQVKDDSIIVTRMLTGFEQFVTHWLGSATALGATSWLQAFTWVATLVAAMIAGIALRRNSLQSRATLLLSLHKTWEDLEQPRRDFDGFFRAIRNEVVQKHADLQEKYQREYMRTEFQNKLAQLRDSRDPQFSQFISFISFFEILGVYVKNGYLPLRDVLQIYKGPILTIDVVWRDFIKAWEKEAHIPPGLLEHAIFLMDMTRARTERRIYFWTIYRFRRYFWN
jgi:hypothetical protein